MSEPEETRTLERQRLILAVLAGRLSVTQAAQELGVSRKTFYEWQQRALSAMLAALRDRPGGRPGKVVDLEKEELQAKVEALEQQRVILESRLRIQTVIRETLDELGVEPLGSKKKRQA